MMSPVILMIRIIMRSRNKIHIQNYNSRPCDSGGCFAAGFSLREPNAIGLYG